MDYGTVNFKGKTYTLTQQASAENYGTNGGVRYYASAVDANGNKHIVIWDTTPEWDAAQAEAEKVARRYAPQSAPEYEYPAILGDESNACDWDNPAEVTPC
jgi:hypothetical protein